MKMNGWWVVFVVSAAAWAQEPRPSVAPFPLELKRTTKNFSEKQRKDVARELRRVLAVSAQLPDTATLDSALAKLEGKNCERDDECLARLAELSGCLYGLYVSVDLSVDEKQVVATGRVVRDDRQLIGPLERIEIPKGARDSFEDLAKQAVTRVVERLIVAQKLPSVRMGKTVPDVVVKVDPEVLPPPPPPPLVVEDTDAGQRSVGKGTLAVGAGLAVVGAALAGIGGGVGYSAKHSGDHAGSTAAAQQVETAQALTTVGFVALGAGVVTVAVGAILWGTARPPPVAQVSVVPVAGGGVVQFGGRF